jgi:hypothetical protein
MNVAEDTAGEDVVEVSISTAITTPSAATASKALLQDDRSALDSNNKHNTTLESHNSTKKVTGIKHSGIMITKAATKVRMSPNHSQSKDVAKALSK